MKNSILHPIFWDLEVEKLDLKENSFQIIERVLEWGGFPQVHWMFKNYSKEDIIEAVKESRQLSKKSANFWADYYQIQKDEVKCLNKSFLAIHRSIWPY